MEGFLCRSSLQCGVWFCHTFLMPPFQQSLSASQHKFMQIWSPRLSRGSPTSRSRWMWKCNLARTVLRAWDREETEKDLKRLQTSDLFCNKSNFAWGMSKKHKKSLLQPSSFSEHLRAMSTVTPVAPQLSRNDLNWPAPFSGSSRLSCLLC